MNYVFLSVVVAEFLTFAAVCFHSKLPWREQGTMSDDEPTASWLQTVLPEFLVGRVDDLLYGANISILLILLGVVAIYLCLLGDVVHQKKSPFEPTATVACELLAGTLFTTVTGRLLVISGGRIHPVLRAIAMIAAFLFATTATFVATMRVENAASQDSKKTLADIRFKPKRVTRHAPASRPRHTRHTRTRTAAPSRMAGCGHAPRPR